MNPTCKMRKLFFSSRYRLPDLSEGQTDAADPLAAYSWQELREMIYGEPAAIPRTSSSQWSER